MIDNIYYVQKGGAAQPCLRSIILFRSIYSLTAEGQLPAKLVRWSEGLRFLVHQFLKADPFGLDDAAQKPPQNI